jgi:MSHA biogenesis protein MshJ
MKLWWKNWWGVQSGRINALSLRERVFLFLSVMACCMALADVLWLSPAQLAHKQLTQRFEKQSADLQRARDELKTVAQPIDAGRGARDEIAALKTRLDSVNLTIKEVLPGTAKATPLAQALIHLLRRHAGLTLVRTSAVASEVSTVTAGQSAGAAALPVGLTRQGIELTVSGSYPDLTQYVQTLENEMPQVRWGVMKLKSDQLPPELTLQLFLLGVQP